MRDEPVLEPADDHAVVLEAFCVVKGHEGELPAGVLERIDIGHERDLFEKRPERSVLGRSRVHLGRGNELVDVLDS